MISVSKINPVQRILGYTLAVGSLAAFGFYFYKFFTRQDDGWFLLALVFIAPLFAGLLAVLIASLLWARGKAPWWAPAGAVVFAIIGYYLPTIFTLWSNFDNSSRYDVFMKSAASKMAQSIYLPAGYAPSRASLSLDGPTSDGSYVNPKTGSKNFGVLFSTVDARTGLNEVAIYDKRLVPDDFGNCAPKDVRTYMDSTLKRVQKEGCNKLLTTPGGRTVYAIGNECCVMDIDTSRIVFPSAGPIRFDGPGSTIYNGKLYKPGTWYVPDDFSAEVDSFQKVELSSINFVDVAGKAHHYQQ